MNQENVVALINEKDKEIGNRTVSSTVVTKRNQQVFSQETVTRKVCGKSSSIDNVVQSSDGPEMNTPEIESTVVCTTDGGPKTIRTTTTKTYRRKIIRRRNANGEVSEEVIEEGDPLCGQMLSISSINSQNLSSLPASGSNSTENLRGTGVSGVSGAANFQGIGGFTSISDSGEEKSSSFSTGPVETRFGNNFQTMIEDRKNLDMTDNGNRLSIPNSSGRSVQEILPDGTTVTRKFFSSKTATVTQSETINGETKTSTKSAFMCYTGESLIQANSTMNDMEALFKEMTAQLKIEGFDVLNRFMLSSSSNVTDHLALAGGSSGSSLFAIENSAISEEPHDSNSMMSKILPRPNKPKSISEFSNDDIPKLPSRESIIKVEEQQQEEVRQKIIAIKEEKASNRLYWSSMDEVKASGILDKMKKEEIHLQEGIFEIITSEASYNISLDILIDHYYNNDLFNPNKENPLINSVEKHHLFSNILLVKAVSLQFLKDLENRWTQNKPKMLDVADIILKHATDSEFEQQYVNYLANQNYQIKSLRSLLQKEHFKNAILNIQNKPQCCKLSLDSFLALPMQRVTRLKLLIDVVMKLMNQTKELYNSIPSEVIANHAKALNKIKELLNKCEAEKYKLEQKARLADLTKYLEFNTGCKSIDIGSKTLIREGEFRAYIPQLYPNALKKLSKKKQPSFYIIVLNDLIIISKKKSSSKFVVLDYCAKNQIAATVYTPSHKLSRDRSVNSQLSSSANANKDLNDTQNQTFLLKFKESESGAVVEPIVLLASSADVRDQWINTITSIDQC